MKTKKIVKDLTQDDLVTLLADASYGSSWIGLDYYTSDYQALENKSERDSVEDKMAKILLAGKFVIIADFNAEDEDDFYGALPHEWDEENECMRYFVSLKTFEKGLSKAFDAKERWVRRCAVEFLNHEDSPCFDITMAETLLQMVLFGTEIYG